MALSGGKALVPIGEAMADEPPGLRQISIMAPERGAPVSVDVWYPAATGTVTTQGASPLFEGVPVVLDAPLAPGVFPLTLLAHGGLRSNPDLAGWIAARLASAGRIVVMVRSPPPGPHAAGEVWLRPADLNAAFDAVTEEPAFAGRIAPEGVSAVGFFLGGTAALLLGGARLDVDAYRAACEASAREKAPAADCRWFAANGIDLHRDVSRKAGASWRDPRIGRVVAIDPELTGILVPESLQAMGVPVMVIRLGSEGEGPRLDGIPGVTSVRLGGAGRFDAFSLCTPRALALLAEEGEDDAICRTGERPRGKVHDDLFRLIEAALPEGASVP